MSNPNPPESQSNPEATESFDKLFSEYEKAHSRKSEGGPKQLEGTVIKLTADAVLLDIGYKSEGALPLASIQGRADLRDLKPGDKLQVTVKGRDPDGYYSLTLGKVARPTDWSALERAFAEGTPILGTVIGAIKGGLSVDVGVRAFMPASRTGVRDAAELEKMVGQEIRCRIIKLDVTDEDVVVDRRVVAEAEERTNRDRLYSEIKEGDTVSGVVRSITDYGAFVDIGGVDGLLHVSDISWGRVNKPADVLSPGQQVEVVVLKMGTDKDKRRVSLGMKQLQPHPWEAVPGKYQTGERVRGTVTRLMDFGAFVELEPGIEGLIHISEMAWSKRARTPSDVVKPGEVVEAVVLGVNMAEHRISLGLKQALGDPWAEVPQRFPVGTIIEGPVTSVQKFGAFIQLAEGVEGMVHVGDLSAEKRINHPSEVLKAGQVTRAQVLAIDQEKRQLRLGIKQMAPSSIDEYIAEHKEGDVVTGRMLETSDAVARVELGEGVMGTCHKPAQAKPEQKEQTAGAAKADLSSLSSMLQSRWKGGGAAGASKPEPVQAGQVRSFKITRLDPATKKVELELV